MESITPIDRIAHRAREAATRHADAQAACPWPAHTEAARLYREQFTAARLSVLEDFVRELLHPEQMGYAVQPWVRDRARVVLGQAPCEARSA